MHQNLSEDLDIKLGHLSFDKNKEGEDWEAFKDVVYNTALAHLDKNTRKHRVWWQPWFSKAAGWEAGIL